LVDPRKPGNPIEISLENSKKLLVRLLAGFSPNLFIRDEQSDAYAL
jgi:hypothetical protein